MLFLKHALATAAASAHACGTDSRTPGRSAEAGQTAELGPWIQETHPAARRLGSCARDSTGSARPPAQVRGRLRARWSSRDGLLPEEDESGPFVVSCSPQPPTVLSLPGPSPALSPSRTRALTACRAASQGDPRAESTLRAGSSSPAPPARPGRPVGSRPSVPLAVGRLGEAALPSCPLLCPQLHLDSSPPAEGGKRAWVWPGTRTAGPCPSSGRWRGGCTDTAEWAERAWARLGASSQGRAAQIPSASRWPCAPFCQPCVHVYIRTRGFCLDLVLCLCRRVPGKLRGGGGGAVAQPLQRGRLPAPGSGLPTS